jgi:ubiquinone/menaquinone biosynthesis C-methylase UbiE
MGGLPVSDGGPRERPDDIQAYYQDPGVVRDYLRRRTAQPLNGLVHRKQVEFINRVLAQRCPARLLEIAPGPARLTAELNFTGCGVGVDASAEMLGVARQRLRDRPGHWLVVRGDAFVLPVADNSADLAMSLRFVRRFQVGERSRLYTEIRRTLAPGGALIIDAQNRTVALPHRQRKGVDTYPVYDALYDRQELIDEVEQHGFRVLELEGIGQHFSLQVRINRLRRYGLSGVASRLIELAERVPGRQASTWMLLAEVAK